MHTDIRMNAHASLKSESGCAELPVGCYMYATSPRNYGSLQTN